MQQKGGACVAINCEPVLKFSSQAYEVSFGKRPNGNRAQGKRPAKASRPWWAFSGPDAQAGAEVRIRWSKALSDAVAPAPMAMTICL